MKLNSYPYLLQFRVPSAVEIAIKRGAEAHLISPSEMARRVVIAGLRAEGLLRPVEEAAE